MKMPCGVPQASRRSSVIVVVLVVFSGLIADGASLPQWKNGATHVSAFLGIDSIAAPDEVKVIVKPAVKLEDQPFAKIWKTCAIFAFIGCCSSSGGLWWICHVRQDRLEANAMTSEDSKIAIATIKSTRHYTTQSTDSQGNTSTTHHYEASYEFEAVRAGGMRCRVRVGNRGQPKAVWDHLSEGAQQQVMYFAEDPTHCRLKESAKADHERSHGLWFIGKIIPGLAFLLYGFYAGVVFVGTRSLLLFATCAFFWVIFMGLSFVSFIKPLLDPKGSSGVIEELGMQKPADHLGDLSGAWLLVSEMGTFEYKLTMSAPTAATVLVEGRPQGEPTWAPQCQGHFMDGEQLNWEDEAGTSFVATFDGPNQFAGCARNSVSCETVSFTGTRQPAAM